MRFRFSSTHFGALLVILSPGLSSGLVGCGGGSKDDGASANTHVLDENNYSVTADLTIPVQETQPGADLEVCWDQVKTDFMGHTVVAGTDTGIKGVHWGEITRLTEAEIAHQFAIGTFDSTKSVKKIRTYPVTDSTKTCAKLSEFHTGASYLVPDQDYVVSTDEYMLLFASSQVQGELTRSAMFIKPTNGSSVTKVNGTSGGPQLQFKADLDKPKVDIPAKGPWLVEWSKLTKDAVGTGIVYQNIDSLRLAFYPGYDPNKLATDALNYDRIQGATYYKAAVVGGARMADLSEAKTDSGQAFSGFDQADAGLWVFALECSKCYLPAPVAVTVLNPKN